METLTACTMNCPDACSLLVGRGAGGRWRIRGNPDHSVTAGFTCRKIHRHLVRLKSPERIVTPLRRKKGGGWEPLGWDAALDLCAEKITALRGDPCRILHIPGDGAKGVLKQAVNRFFAELGSTAVHGSLCDAAGIAAGRLDCGSRLNHRLEDLSNAARIVNWGRDVARSSIHLGALLTRARRRGVKVLAISPGGDDTARFCDETIRIRPGSDRFLALAAIRRRIAEKAPDPGLIERIDNWPAFRELAGRQDDAALRSACGVSAAQVERLAEWYADDRPTATLIGGGPQRYRFGGENVRFINALALISGHVGRPGGGSNFHLNSMERFNLDWARPAVESSRRSLPIAAIGAQIEAADPPIELIWINGTNIVNQAPDSRRIARAFANVPFKVVVDAFFNDTVQRADLVLPTTLMLEQEDLIGSYLHDFIHYVAAAIDPPDQARSDGWIVRQLGLRLRPAVEIPDAETCLRAALRSCDLDVGLAELRRKGFARTRQPDVPYRDLCFDHPGGRACLPEEIHASPATSCEYPLRLLSLLRGGAMHSQMAPEEQQDIPRAWISPGNPILTELPDDRAAWLVSPLGRLKVKLEVLPDLHPEAVIYRRGDWMALGGGINQLVAGGLADLADNWACYDQCIRIEKE